MAIDFMKAAISAGVGAIDEYLERDDVKNARTGNFKTYSDIGRAGMAILGYAGMIMMPRYDRYLEGMALGATSLLVKSVAKAVVKESTTPAASAATSRDVNAYLAKVRPQNRASNVSNKVARNYQPDFMGVTSW